MGKSAGKWFKTLLLGKKASKSHLSKGREKLNSASKGEALVSSEVAESEIYVGSPVISAPIPTSGSSNEIDSGRGVPSQLPSDGVNVSSAEEGGHDNASHNFALQEGPESVRLEQAATKAQAAFRGYLARRAFRTLKGIIRLQALIRSHLVRRQAVATLYCVWGIVKIQALARGQSVRRSDVGIAVQKIHMRALLSSKGSKLHKESGHAGLKNLTDNAFVWKLLALSPTPLPLRLQYGPGELNSAQEWLERWTRSHFWKCPFNVRNLALKSQVKAGNSDTEQSKSKRNARKASSGKFENGFSRSTSDQEKPKRNIRKVSSNPVESVRAHPKNDSEKAKRNLRKLSDSTKEVSDRLEVSNERPKQTLKKTSAVLNVSGQDSSERRQDAIEAQSEQLTLENLKLSAGDESIDESQAHPVSDLKTPEKNDKIENTEVANSGTSPNDQIDSESLRMSQRRASLPAKINNQENGLLSTPKVPSYMAPTESAKAKLRGQCSPRLSNEVIEKNGLTRRHSLPSSTNGNPSGLSPRAQRLVQVAGKGAMKDKSLSSSRDVGEKVIKAEWKR